MNEVGPKRGRILRFVAFLGRTLGMTGRGLTIAAILVVVALVLGILLMTKDASSSNPRQATQSQSPAPRATTTTGARAPDGEAKKQSQNLIHHLLLDAQKVYRSADINPEMLIVVVEGTWICRSQVLVDGSDPQSDIAGMCATTNTIVVSYAAWEANWDKSWPSLAEKLLTLIANYAVQQVGKNLDIECVKGSILEMAEQQGHLTHEQVLAVIGQITPDDNRRAAQAGYDQHHC